MKKIILSHYHEKVLERLTNPDKFVEKYRDKIDNPILVGYLIHILTDRFYNEYFLKRRVRKYLLICDYFVDNRKDPLIQVRVID